MRSRFYWRRDEVRKSLQRNSLDVGVKVMMGQLEKRDDEEDVVRESGR